MTIEIERVIELKAESARVLKAELTTKLGGAPTIELRVGFFAFENYSPINSKLF